MDSLAAVVRLLAGAKMRNPLALSGKIQVVLRLGEIEGGSVNGYLP